MTAALKSMGYPGLFEVCGHKYYEFRQAKFLESFSPSTYDGLNGVHSFFEEYLLPKCAVNTKEL